MKKSFSELKKVLFLLKPIWKQSKTYVILCLIISGIVTPINAISSVLFTQIIVDAVSEEKPFAYVLIIILIFLCVLLLVVVTQNLFDVLYKEAKWEKISLKINADVYNKVLSTDYKYFDNPEFYNNYTWSINEYVAKANEALTLIQNICRSISTIISMTTLISILGPWIILFTVIEMIVTVFFEAKKNRLALQKREELVPIERKIGYVHRIFYQKEFAEDIKTTRLPNLLKNMYACNGNSKINTIKKYAPKILFWLYAQNFIGILYNAIIMGYISYCILVTKSIVGIGKFSSLITANSQLVNSLYSFFAFLSQADNLGLYAKRIEEFMNSPSHIESQNISEIKKAVLKGAIKVEFNNVCFSYDNSQFSLKNINLKVFPGETVAIVGANGAGKTTISKLLLRLYDIDSGEISLNDKSISSYDIKTLRNNIGVVYQRNNIYALSFSDNVQLHNEYSIPEMEKTIDELRLNDVLKKSNADVTSQMTREFDECGILLSGGELQKMGIARVINSSAGLLILDEPSSALDPIAEYELTGILKSKSKYTTTIIISHRLSTVKHADRIYVMANGEIVEQGTHTELMANSKMYSEMFKKQSEFYK